MQPSETKGEDKLTNGHASRSASADSSQATTAANLVPEMIKRSVFVSNEAPALVHLGLVCARALYITERNDLSRLVELETLAEYRFEELKRSEKALERETRRLEREVRRLEMQKTALDGYHNILSYPRHHDDDEDEDEGESDEYDDDEEDEEDDQEDRVGLALAINEVLRGDSSVEAINRKKPARKDTSSLDGEAEDDGEESGGEESESEGVQEQEVLYSSFLPQKATIHSIDDSNE